LASLLFVVGVASQAVPNNVSCNVPGLSGSIYDYTVTALNGTSFPLSSLKGMVVVIFNSASF